MKDKYVIIQNSVTASSISVALCTYNGAPYLMEQLESIAAQRRTPDEVIICDDGSRDDTIEVIRRFLKTSPFPTRFEPNQRHLGFAKNFENAIGLCTGDLIALADQDDLWYPNKLEVLSRLLEQDPRAGYVCSDADLINSNAKAMTTTRWRKALVRFLPSTNHLFPIQLRTLVRENIVCGSAMMFRSSLKPIFLPICGSWAHDYWIAMVATLTGNHGIGVTDSLMKYRIHPKQAFGLHPRPWNLLRRLRSAPKDVWAKDAAMFRELRDTIQSRPDLLDNCKEGDLQLLDQKIAHLMERDLARSSRGRIRWNAVLGEMRNGRYEQFSFSWKSALRDLLLP